MIRTTNPLYTMLYMSFTNLINLHQDRKKYDIQHFLTNTTSNKILLKKTKTLELKKIIDNNIELIISFCQSIENLNKIKFELKDDLGFYKSRYFNDSLKIHSKNLGIELSYIFKKEYNTLEFTVSKIA